MGTTVTKRTLTKWRREALQSEDKVTITDPLELIIWEYSQRILRLTQILLDQELMKGK